MRNIKIAAVLLFAAATVSAQDLKMEDVPSNLMTTFSSAYANAKDIEWEKKGNDFKVEFEVNRLDHDIWYDAQGGVIKSKIEISASALPSIITSAVKTKYPDYKIDSVEVLELNGVKSYKVEIEKGWINERKLVIDASGKILRDIED